MITEIILAVQTGVFAWGLESLNHMRKQEAIQSYIALSDRLFKQNLLEVQDVRLFASLDYADGKYPDENLELNTKIKHYLFMQFTMYEQMFCLHESCKDNMHAMDPWSKRFLSLIKKERMKWYWREEYHKQSCDGFKGFVECCLEANSYEEVVEFFNKRKLTHIAKYCPFSSTCNG
jgi:hypothetical protein